MTGKDWLTACGVAGAVAAVTVVVASPPLGWAGPSAVVAVPSLPSTGLNIPSIKALVSAHADPSPGKPVQVTLSLKSPAEASGTQVPVTITVLRTSMSILSRVVPPSTQVARVNTTVGAGADGSGSTVVELPLRWAAPAVPAAATLTPPANTTANAAATPRLIMLGQVTNFRMVLSSPLGGKAAAAELQTVPVIQAAARKG